MSVKITSSYFVEQLELALKRNDPYLMGAHGQKPCDLKYGINNWLFEQYKDNDSQYDRAKLALKRSKENPNIRAWDCNGLLEGIYELATGTDINERARDNYHSWCGIKGSGYPTLANRIPGCCVFSSSTGSVSNITHVGYLYKPVNESEPNGDWWVIEARGVMYGVVKTKLYSRSWKWWGLCTKYVNYENAAMPEPVTYKLGSRVLRKGDDGDDVAELQNYLVALGFDVGKWGSDGDFGTGTETAVKAFQYYCGLREDGIYGPDTHAALVASLAAQDEPEPVPATTPDAPHIIITGDSVNVRVGPGTEYAIASVAHKDDKLVSVQVNGWYPVLVNGEIRWVSPKMAKVGGE